MKVRNPLLLFSGCFFTHFIPSDLIDELTPSENGLEVVERVYSTSAPPPSCVKKADYNLGRVLTRGRLLCEYLAECLTILGNGDALAAPIDCCWRASEEEEALEAELGRAMSRLSARSSAGAKDSQRSSSVASRSESRQSGRRSGERLSARSEVGRKEEKIEEESREGEENEENPLSSRRLLEKNEVSEIFFLYTRLSL